MSIDAVVADANVLLSAVIGKAALRVIVEYSVQVHVTDFNSSEVKRYIPRLCEKFSLPQDVVELQWRLLPVKSHPQREYEGHLGWARGQLENRDPDDVHPLALAKALELPLWSNDSDLQGHGIDCHTTAVLLKRLG
jgi:predicted nucleic acid-binding protein